MFAIELSTISQLSILATEKRVLPDDAQGHAPSGASGSSPGGSFEG
jgi:hypothetical protein